MGWMLQVNLGEVVQDIPPPLPVIAGAAVCQTPDEFRAHRKRFGNPTYAVKLHDDATADRWHFANELQDAVAIGMRWHERGCAIEQYPVEQGGEIVFGYRIRNYMQRAVEEALYETWLWDGVGGDINAKATPEILTRLRHALFKFLSESGIATFFLLDFSRPDGVEEFLQDWADEIS